MAKRRTFIGQLFGMALMPFMPKIAAAKSPVIKRMFKRPIQDWEHILCEIMALEMQKEIDKDMIKRMIAISTGQLLPLSETIQCDTRNIRTEWSMISDTQFNTTFENVR